ncbi:MAG TPA: hypothetical protein VGM90_15900 [Kofleriaceae bacterium]
MLLWKLVFGAIAVSLAYGAYLREQRRERIQKRIHAGTQDSVAHGTTIVGKIVDTDAFVESPLSGRKGVVVSTWAVMPEPDHEGLPVEVRATLAVPFYLRRSDGVLVRIESKAFDIALQGDTPKRDSKREEAFMVARGRHPISALAASFREAVLSPGMWVQVNGDRLEDEPAEGEGPARKKLVAADGKRLALDVALPPR